MITPRSLFAAILTAVIIGVVIGAFFLVGSPANERLRHFDEQRSQDLQALRFAGVDEYMKETGKLPVSLEDIQKTVVMGGNTDPFTDPETGAAYEYAKTADNTFLLCATFELPSDTTVPSPEYPMNPDVFWTHPAGRTCFNFKEQSVGPTKQSSVPIP